MSVSVYEKTAVYFRDHVYFCCVSVGFSSAWKSWARQSRRHCFRAGELFRHPPHVNSSRDNQVHQSPADPVHWRIAKWAVLPRNRCCYFCCCCCCWLMTLCFNWFYVDFTDSLYRPNPHSCKKRSSLFLKLLMGLPEYSWQIADSQNTADRGLGKVQRSSKALILPLPPLPFPVSPLPLPFPIPSYPFISFSPLLFLPLLEQTIPYTLQFTMGHRPRNALQNSLFPWWSNTWFLGLTLVHTMKSP